MIEPVTPDADEEDGVVIHSWRDVFHNSWRIHSFLGWRPDIPGGIDGVFVVYFMLGVVVVTLMDYTPGASLILGWMWWLPRHVVIPAYVAWILTMATPDDRTAVRYLTARLRMWLENVMARQYDMFGRRMPPRREGIPIRHDGTGAGRPQPGLVVGPAHVEIHRPVKLTTTGKGYIAKPDPDGETGPIVLGARTTFRVR